MTHEKTAVSSRRKVTHFGDIWSAWSLAVTGGGAGCASGRARSGEWAGPTKTFISPTSLCNLPTGRQEGVALFYFPHRFAVNPSWPNKRIAAHPRPGRALRKRGEVQVLECSQGGLWTRMPSFLGEASACSKLMHVVA